MRFLEFFVEMWGAVSNVMFLRFVVLFYIKNLTMLVALAFFRSGNIFGRGVKWDHYRSFKVCGENFYKIRILKGRNGLVCFDILRIFEY